MRVSVLLISALVAATGSAGVYVSTIGAKEMLRSDDLSEFNFYASLTSLRGERAIPEYVAVLEASPSNKFGLLEIGKTNASIVQLRKLAARGIVDVKAVPTLLRVIGNQLAIADTLPTAELLREITGVDTGYDRRFVESYTERDEDARQEKIRKWHEWHETNPRANQNGPGIPAKGRRAEKDSAE